MKVSRTPSKDMMVHDQCNGHQGGKFPSLGGIPDRTVGRQQSRPKMNREVSQGPMGSCTLHNASLENMSIEQMIRHTSKEFLPRQPSRGQLPRQTSRGQITRQDSRGQLGRQDSRGQLSKQDSRGQIDNASLENMSIEQMIRHTSKEFLPRQPSRGQLPRQDSRGQLTRQDSRGQVGRQDSRGQLAKQDSRGQLARQPSREQLARPSRLPRQLSSKNMTSGCCVHDEYLSQPLERDTKQNSKPKWQDSLRGSSAPNRKHSIERDNRERLINSSQEKQNFGVSESGFTFGRASHSTSPRRRSSSQSNTRRSSRSKSGSPNRLFSSTYSSRAKQNEAIDNETSTLPRRSSRTSQSPMRSRTNSTSLRESSRPVSPPKRSSSSTKVEQRRPSENFPDDEDEGQDPLASYTSFQKFRENKLQNGQSINSFTATATYNNNSSDSYATKFNSDANYKTYTTKDNSHATKKDESQAKYQTTSSKLANGQHSSNGLNESQDEYIKPATKISGSFTSNKSLENESFSNGIGKRLSGSYASSRASGYYSDNSFSGSLTSSDAANSSSKFTSNSSSGEFEFEKKSPKLNSFQSSGKVSLGALKKPSIENWESKKISITDTDNMERNSDNYDSLERSYSFRKGSSLTYIG